MKYLAFCGSTRSGSINQRTVKVMTSCLTSLGTKVTEINLTNLGIPIYDGDLEKENGLPDGIVELQEQIHAHDGLLIGCPEYNGYMTPLLLNAIDWATRSSEGSPDLLLFAIGPCRL